MSFTQIQFSDTLPSDPHQRPTGLWHSLRNLWCRHRDTVIAPRADGMPAHVVCQSCGWREPVMAAAPQPTRTWDSSRDEARYRLEKKRRTAVEEQRQLVIAKLATPGPRGRTRSRRSSSNLLHMKPAVGE